MPTSSERCVSAELGVAVGERAVPGPDLREANDELFQQLEEAAYSARQLVRGEPSVETDWHKVVSIATELTERTVDFRVASALTRGLLRTEGLPGFTKGVGLVHRYVADFWEAAHPLPDGDDCAYRLNQLASLAEHSAVLHPLRSAVLARASNGREVTARNLDLVVTDAGDDLGDAIVVTSSDLLRFLSDLRGSQAALNDAARTCRLIGEALAEHEVDAESAGVLQPLGLELERLAGHAMEAIRRFDSPCHGLEREASAGSESHASGRAHAAPPNPGAMEAESVGKQEVSSRAMVASPDGVLMNGALPDSVEAPDDGDVFQTLEQLSQQIRRREPSSPVPYALDLAKALAGKSFFEAIDLLPDGVLDFLRTLSSEKPNDA